MTSRLVQTLLDQAALSREDWERVEREAARKKTDPEKLLIQKEIVSARALAQAQAVLFEIPFVDLERTDVPHEVVAIIPQAVAEHNKLVVFEHAEKEVSVALVKPADYRAIEAIDFWAKKEGYKLHMFITTLEGYAHVMKSYTPFRKEVGQALEVLEERHELEETIEKKAKFNQFIRRAPVAKIVALIIKEAVRARASDIHIEPGGQETRVRYRIDGILRAYLTLPFHLHASIVSRIKVLAGLKIDETRIPQDGRIHLEVDGDDINLRISTLPLMGHEKVVMRILPTETKVITLEQLGFWKRTLEVLNGIIARPAGVVLVSGPTGSGKSTTLFSLLTALNKETVNIITLEDPVEYFLAGVNQVQVNAEVGLTFASGLRAILRQDPNIVMVGEIRDRETAELATHAALTGHFMLSTIHSKDVLGVIPRLIDMHVEPFLISAAVNTLIAQRLVRLICPKCKVVNAIPPNIEKEVRSELEKIPDKKLLEGISPVALEFYKGAGCESCGKTGYKGRTVVSEIVQMTDPIRELLSKEFTIDQLAREMRAQGHISLKQDTILKAVFGLTTLEEMLRVTREAE